MLAELALRELARSNTLGAYDDNGTRSTTFCGGVVMEAAESEASAVKIYLFGPLSIVGPTGDDLTPRNQKSKAVLAMLALAPRGSRSRVWLRDKLWSDRAETQASASLRQALLEIRKALGSRLKDLVQTNKYSVTLDLDRVQVDVIERLGGRETGDRTHAADTEANSEHFLEGFDICDPEFENWLTLERRIWDQRFENMLGGGPTDKAIQAAQLFDLTSPGFSNEQGRKVAAPKPTSPSKVSSQQSGWRRNNWAIGVQCLGAPDRADSEFARLLGDKLARHLSDIARIKSLWLTDDPKLAEGVQLPLNVRITEYNHQSSVRLTVEVVDCTSGVSLWSAGQAFQRNQLEGPHAPILNGLVSRAVIELGAHLQAPGSPEEIVLGGRLIESVNRIFSLSAGDLDEAEAALTQILKVNPSAQAHAWMAFAKSFRVGQRFSPDTAEQVAESQYHSARALETDQFDPLVLSLAAHIHSYLFSEYDIAASLFERALRTDPEQTIGWDLYAMLNAYTGQPGRALTMASWAQHLGGNTPISYYFDTTNCIAATLAGNYKQADQVGRQALVARPNFNTILRYLISANAHLGNVSAVEDLRQKLAEIEPDFSTDVLAATGYPGLSTEGGQQFLLGLKKAGLGRRK